MDLATLGLRFESQEAVTAEQRLDGVAKAAGRAEAGAGKTSGAMLRLMEATLKSVQAIEQQITAASRVSAEYDKAAASANSMAAAEAQVANTAKRSADVIDLAQRRAARAHKDGADAAKLQGHEVLNLSRNFADVGVMLASGQNPFVTLIQQGPQIADVFQSAAMRGVGFRSAVGGLMADLAPMAGLLGGVALATGAAVGGFALFAHAVDESSKMSLQWGDVWKGTIKVVGDAITDGPIGEGWKWLQKTTGAVLAAIAEGTLSWLDRIVGFWGAAYLSVTKNWRQLPQVLATIMQAAVNNAIWAVEGLVNAVVRGINKLAGKDLISEMHLPRLKVVSGEVADAFEKDQARISASFKASREAMFRDIVKASEDAARAREAEEAGKKRSKKATDEEADAVRDLLRNVEALNRARMNGQKYDTAWRRANDNMPSAQSLADAEYRQQQDRLKAVAMQNLQVEAEILQQRMSMASSMSERLQIEQAIAANTREQELATKGYTNRLILGGKALERAQLEAGYQDLSSSLGGATRALEQGDWGAAVAGLMDAIKAFQVAAQSGAGKLGAIAGIASAAGQAIGGTAGSALSGAGSGAMAGFMVGGPIGAAIGGIIGGITGILGGNKKKDEERQRQREAEAQRQAQILAQRQQLEIAIMEAQGDAVGALAMQRQIELAGMDASNRALAERLYALQDEAKATAEAAQAAQELAEKAARLGEQRQGLQISLLEAEGRAIEAVAMQRRIELDALDESLRGLQQAVWRAQDLAAATAELAAANDNLAAAEANLADLQREAAERAAQAIVDQLQTVADAAKTTLDQVTEANEAAKQKVETARSALSAAYQREAGALQGTIDQFRSFAASLRDFRQGLALANASPADRYRATSAAFSATATAAVGGDLTALGNLQASAEAFLDASKGAQASQLDYLRDVAKVREALRQAEDAAGGKADIAEQQLDALKASVSGLLDINDSVIGVQDAIAALTAAQGEQSQAQAAVDAAQAVATAAIAQVQAAQAAMAAQQAAFQQSQQESAMAAAIMALAAAQQRQNEAQAGVDRANSQPREPDWQSYLTHYADVAAEYARLVAAGERDWWGSATAFGQWHWETSGKAEGRTPYARGGVFTNGIVTRPTSFHNSEMGEAGSEAIMPLVMGPDGLGVRASNDNRGMVRLLGELIERVARLQAALEAIAKNTSKTARQSEKTTDTLDRLSSGGDALRTTAA